MTSLQQPAQGGSHAGVANMTGQTNPAQTPPRLLIVDDEPGVLTVLRETLSRAGYHVEVASGGAEALEILRRQAPFALILTDQRMPEMTGLDFLRQVKDLQPDAARILMTGVVEINIVLDAINSGEIFRFVVKPWLREELLVTIHNGVQRHELLTRNAELHRATVAMNEELAQLNESLQQRITREAEQNQNLAGLNHALERNLQRSVELCLKILQTFYPGLGAQARRAWEVAKAIAEGLKMPSDQQRVLELSALLHDIGLVGVPRRIIHLAQTTPRVLNEAERVLVEQHPVLGQELAGFAHHLAEVGSVIRAHHERFDGRGYPDGLKGEEIPWLARLLAVAAAFAESDAREGAPMEAVGRGSGSLFDPEAVRALKHYRPQALAQQNERAVLISEIEPGMVLAKGIYTANGLLLMAEGQVLNEAYIGKLRNHNRINPIKQTLLVYC